jgi:hypothetical protein
LSNSPTLQTLRPTVVVFCLLLSNILRRGFPYVLLEEQSLSVCRGPLPPNIPSMGALCCITGGLVAVQWQV